ncbi:hypothetical protein ASPWEDRAFT_101905 [Aspergillus wentii DTO 134E9]|uniref:dolichyl-phosphate beta-glucosyltransferase n=1 Tax=Aspergillus wentii DTO 134E9 TaxID=1073089 RepID=A0A1L9S336_ASPWE|nr:uncharacterized protein ASPWEDRAFT_101905 [Aspergillus wentii DTO 134E9]OJJ41576.1 hypothetical protein ASPWEDRAFT_101905 [Aspergillus wentii DTO 134E9]
MADLWSDVCVQCRLLLTQVPLHILVVTLLTTFVGFSILFYLFVFIVAPVPRPPFPQEKKYRTIAKDGSITTPETLPCWCDPVPDSSVIEKADVFMSVVVPAYNEEDRLGGMLEEAVEYLDGRYGVSVSSGEEGTVRQRKGKSESEKEQGWEIIVVSDGSKDKTEEVAFGFARDHGLAPGAIRVVTLSQNRGKGGAVTHGMRHVRGQYVVFADADGASRFEDLGKLVTVCGEIEDGEGRGVAVGSRAHMVGSEAVVKRSKLRNFLMHSFHLILRILTPRKTATIKDTQCGFKLFSRGSLPYIIPYMHSEGWIFDVEMLMLAEFAGIPVAEVPVGWREVKGSKLNVLRDSIGMAWGLAILRAAWSIGVYRT